MNWLITGARGCGKSAIAERHALSSDTVPLYVGTLPRNDATLARIHAHKARRNNAWSLMEATAAWPCVSDELSARLESQTSVLLDGLSSLLWLQVVEYGARAADLREAAVKLQQMLVRRARADAHVVVVDCAIPFPNLGREFWFNALMRDVHADYAVSAQWLRVEPPTSKAS